MSRFSTKIESINPKYNEVLKQYDRQAKQALARACTLVKNTAEQSIHASQSSGRKYGKHIASTAGNPPNSDEGYLAQNIFVNLDNDKLGGSVESRADYSEALEYGTSKMAARPFMQPALEENRNKIERLFSKLRSK
jgi:HK97 gp10 family phage protein